MFEKQPPAGLDMIVLDEGHHQGAPTVAYLYNRIRPRYVVSMSATPFRMDKVKLLFSFETPQELADEVLRIRDRLVETASNLLRRSRRKQQ
jgi:superfamily II DNA or RNA helicase